MIHILEKTVADKIAAGEVVDRPLAVVKELVENAVDALPGSITIEIEKGGKTYIRVTDNGCGIEAEDVEKAFQRHATSKIQRAEDLETIKTLGFRGEALPSIAAVSRVEIVTKTRQAEAGKRLVLEGGNIVENTQVGCENGTTVIVRDLFYNTPARLKFMKSDGAESTAIIEFVSQMALAYTNIKFRLISNKTMLFSTRGTCNRYDNILTIYSKIVGEDLIPLAAGCETMEMEGYISNPGESKTNKKQQIFFINGRVIKSRVIETAIANAYADRLFKGRHPIAYLFLRIDPGLLDVNIHPNKLEVKFHNPKEVEAFITDAVKKALKGKESIPRVKEKDVFKLPKRQHEETSHISAAASESQDMGAPGNTNHEKNQQVDLKDLLTNIRDEQAKAAPDNSGNTLGDTEETSANIRETKTPYAVQKDGEGETAEAATPPPFDFTRLNVTGSVFGTYITAKDENNFYFIDQHAAHERIFFEKLLDQYKKSEKLIQPIMVPFTLDVSYSVKENQYDWLSAVKDMGFDIEEFGPKTYIVKGIPMFTELAEAEDFLRDFLDNCTETTDFENQNAIEKIIMKSCKSAIKAHDYISREEIDALIKDLAQCVNPFSCPHGRPTFIKLTKHQIEKMFKRV